MKGITLWSLKCLVVWLSSYTPGLCNQDMLTNRVTHVLESLEGA